MHVYATFTLCIFSFMNCWSYSKVKNKSFIQKSIKPRKLFVISIKISALQCTDIDECKAQTADCALNATCSDTDGGYTCTCKSGFEGSGKQCTGISMSMY